LAQEVFIRAILDLIYKMMSAHSSNGASGDIDFYLSTGNLVTKAVVYTAVPT